MKKRIIFGLLAALILPISLSGNSKDFYDLNGNLNECDAKDVILQTIRKSVAKTYVDFGENVSPVLSKEENDLKLQFQFKEDYFNQLITDDESSQKVTVYYGMTIDGSEKSAEEIIAANVASNEFELNKGGLVSLNFKNRNTAKYANNLYQAVLVATINEVEYCSSVIYGQYAEDGYSGVVSVDSEANSFKFQAKNMNLEGNGRVESGNYFEYTDNTTKLTQEFDLKNGGGYYRISVLAADLSEDQDFTAYIDDSNREDAYMYVPTKAISTGSWENFEISKVFDYVYLSEGLHDFHIDGIDNGAEDKSMCNIKEVIFEKIDVSQIEAVNINNYKLLKADEISQFYLENTQNVAYVTEESESKINYSQFTYGLSQAISLNEETDLEMTVNFATQNVGSLSLFIDGVDTNKDLEFSSTGSWNSNFHNNKSINLGTLSAGNHIVELRKNSNESSINVYAISFSKLNSLNKFTGDSLNISATIAPEVTNTSEDGSYVEYTPKVLTYQFNSEIEGKAYVSLEYANGSLGNGGAVINGTEIALPMTYDWSTFAKSTEVEINLVKGVNTILLTAVNECNPKNLNIRNSKNSTYEGNNTIRLEAENAIDYTGTPSEKNGVVFIENAPSTLTYRFNSSVEGDAFIRLYYASDINQYKGYASVKINNNEVFLPDSGDWDTTFIASKDVRMHVIVGENTITLTDVSNFNPDYLEVSYLTAATKQTESNNSELKYRFKEAVYDQGTAYTDNGASHVWGINVNTKFTFRVDILDGEGNRRFFFQAYKNYENVVVRLTVNDQIKELTFNQEWMIFENEDDKMFFKNGINIVTFELISGESLEMIQFGVNRKV